MVHEILVSTGGGSDTHPTGGNPNGITPHWGESNHWKMLILGLQCETKNIDFLASNWACFGLAQLASLDWLILFWFWCLVFLFLGLQCETKNIDFSASTWLFCFLASNWLGLAQLASLAWFFCFGLNLGLNLGFGFATLCPILSWFFVLVWFWFESWFWFWLNWLWFGLVWLGLVLDFVL